MLFICLTLGNNGKQKPFDSKYGQIALYPIQILHGIYELVV